MELRKILIVEDSPPTREYLTELVQILGFRAHAVMQKTNFLADLNQENPDLLLLGSCNNPGQVKAFTKVVELERRSMPIIFIRDGTDQLKPEGIFDEACICCLPDGFKPDDLKVAIDRLIDESQVSVYAKLDEIIVGQSSVIVEIKKYIVRLSKADVTVLITGESGTGKELVAKAIHDYSARAKRPFIKVNSAALPGNLMESELFGYEKGAFTGAYRSKPGKFVLAHSGTLLLDEVGEIPLHLQPKLLQVLEDDELSVLGGTTNARIDVRVLAATNSNLKRKVSEGYFRSDLFYRLNVAAIHIPPLRDRLEDIAPLCEHFLVKHSDLNGKESPSMNRETREQMYCYTWPGNVRELENTIKSIAVLGDEKSFLDKLRNQRMGGDSWRGQVHGQPGEVGTDQPRKSVPGLCLKDVCREAARKAETEAILEALTYTRWNRRKAAELLRISYKALLNKIKEYKIERKYRDFLNRDAERGMGHRVQSS